MRLCLLFAAPLLAGVLLVPAGAPAQSTAAIPCDRDYTVARGDTLGTIAQRAYGRSARYRALYAVNAARIGSDINSIEVGTRLSIPCDPETAPPAASLPPLETSTVGTPQQLPFDRSRRQVEIVFNKPSAPEMILNRQIIDPFLAEITRVTRGRVRFVAPATVNRDPEVQLELVRSGKVDGAYLFNGHIAEINPLVQISMRPMTGGSALQTALALWRTHEAYSRPTGPFEGVHLLGFVGGAPSHLWRVPSSSSGSVPLATIAPVASLLEGLALEKNIRPGETQLRRIGRPGPASGQTDAFVALAYGTARSSGIWERARSVIEIPGGLNAPTYSVVISEAKWMQISPRDQEAIRRLSGERLALRSSAWDAFENAERRWMQARGLKVTQADFDLLVQIQGRAQHSWEQWIQHADAAGIPGYEVINAFFREMETLRRRYPAGRS